MGETQSEFEAVIAAMDGESAERNRCIDEIIKRVNKIRPSDPIAGEPECIDRADDNRSDVIFRLKAITRGMSRANSELNRLVIRLNELVGI